MEIEIVTREEAKRMGLVRYFLNTMCKNGHTDFRYTNTGICYACKRQQNISCNTRNKGSLKQRCKRSYIKNKDKHNARSLAWSRNNREASNLIKRNSRIKNLDKVRTSAAKRMRERRKTDIKFRLHKNISKEVWSVLKGRKQGKTFLKFIDYSIDQVYDHLQSLFTNKMSWDNYGTYWEIDHVKPLKMFEHLPVKEAIKQAWCLTNLQPLEISLNRSKQDRFIATRKQIIEGGLCE